MEPLDRDAFRSFVSRNATMASVTGSRHVAFAAMLDGLDPLVRAGEGAAMASGLPRIVGTAMQAFGWDWNGFYVRGQDDRLHLGPAHGPPVCTPLEASDGGLGAGMCWDCIATGQTLAVHDVEEWPGYVLCDGPSGLATVSSIVCPVVEGVVWDLDATARIESADVRFMDVLIRSVARFTPLRPFDFGTFGI
jgi:putative methionine-R-sulfoxide reductase with GAF domain